MIKPEMIKMGILACAVCVPSEWDDNQIIDFAEKEYHAGVSGGWHVRHTSGDKEIELGPTRILCSEKPDYVHVVLVV